MKKLTADEGSYTYLFSSPDLKRNAPETRSGTSCSMFFLTISSRSCFGSTENTSLVASTCIFSMSGSESVSLNSSAMVENFPPMEVSARLAAENFGELVLLCGGDVGLDDGNLRHLRVEAAPAAGIRGKTFAVRSAVDPRAGTRLMCASSFHHLDVRDEGDCVSPARHRRRRQRAVGALRHVVVAAAGPAAQVEGGRDRRDHGQRAVRRRGR